MRMLDLRSISSGFHPARSRVSRVEGGSRIPARQHTGGFSDGFLIASKTLKGMITCRSARRIARYQTTTTLLPDYDGEGLQGILMCIVCIIRNRFLSQQLSLSTSHQGVYQLANIYLYLWCWTNVGSLERNFGLRCDPCEVSSLSSIPIKSC